MGTRTVLNRLYGLTEPVMRKPSRLTFSGLNYDSSQMQGLTMCLPMWEVPGAVCQDLGPNKITGRPFNVLSGYDPEFGDVYLGDGKGSGGTTDGSRGYTFLNAEVRPFIDFGLGASRPFSMSFWFKSIGIDPGTDMYLISFDDPLSSPTPFSGFAVSLDTGHKIACNTGNPQTTDAGFKTSPLFDPFDTKWHHFVFTHAPSGNLATFNARSTYYVDGRFDGQSTACADIGTCANNMYIGVDDDGLSQQFGGAFCDFRLYNRELQLADAQRMYHLDTRWELYTSSRPAWASILFKQSVAYTLNAGPGVVGVTGAVASLLAARRLAATGGSYTETGAADTLKLVRTIAATAGTYATTGAAAKTLAARILSGVAGTYVFSGAALTALRGIVLSTAAGSYAVSGAATTLVYGAVTSFAINAGAGTYTLSGANAGTIAHHLLSSLAGSLALTGKHSTSRLESEDIPESGGGGSFVVIVND